MPEFKEALKLTDHDFPPELHERIMAEIRFIKYRKIFFSISAISLFGVLFSSWEIIKFSMEFGTFSVLSDFLPGFEPSWSFLADLASLFKDILPTMYASVFLASFISLFAEGFWAFSRRKIILREKLNF